MDFSATPTLSIRKITAFRWFWPVAIFILAALFRLTNLDIIEFKADEALAVFHAAKFYIQPYIQPVSGLSSIGVYYPPLHYYLVTLLALFSREPEVITFFIAFLNSAGVVGFYYVVKKCFGQWAAVVSSLILAFSPWSIVYSRKIWNPDLLLLFLIPYLYYLHKLVVDRNPKAVLPVSLLLVLLSQLHFSGIYLIVVTAVILLTQKVKVDINKAVIGISIGLLPLLPYIFFNLTSQPLCRDCVAFWQYQQLPKAFHLDHLVRPLQFVSGSDFHILLGKDYGEFLKAYPLISSLTVFFWVKMVLFVTSLVYVMIRKRNFLYLYAPVVLLPLLYFFSKVPAYIYYVVIVSPFLYILVGIAAQDILLKTKQRVYTLLIVSLAVIWLFADTVFNYHLYSYIRGKKIIEGDYGPALVVKKEFVERWVNRYQHQPYFAELKSYAYVFSKPEHIHSQLGEYFVAKRNYTLAMEEYSKAIELNPKDVASRANFIMLAISLRKFEEAKLELEILKTQDGSISAQLENLLEKNTQSAKKNI